MAIFDGRDACPATTQDYPPYPGLPDPLPYSTTALILVNASDVTIQDLEIRNSAGSGLEFNRLTTNTSNPVYKERGIVRNVKVHDCRWQPFAMNWMRDSIVEDVEFYRGGRYAPFDRSVSVTGFNWSQCAQLQDCIRTRVRRFKVYEHWGEGISIPGGDDNSFEDGEVHHCFSGNIYINRTSNCSFKRVFCYHSGADYNRGGSRPNGVAFNNESAPKQAYRPLVDNVTVENCVFVGYGNCLEWQDQGTRESIKNVTVRNCTFVESWEAAVSDTAAIGFTDTTYVACVIENCVFYQTRGSWIVGASNASSGVIFRNNAFYGLSAALPSVAAHAGNVLTDPRLVNPVIPSGIGTGVAANYKPRSNSPLVNAGRANGVTNDITGLTRTAAPDIGAFEVTTTTGTIEAAFSLSPTGGEAPVTIVGTNASTSTNGITSYLWNWGDGSTSATANASHAYTTPGTYTVTLTVTGPDGTDSATQQVVITAAGTGVCFKLLYRKCGESCIREIPPPPGPGYVLVSTDTGDGFEWQVK